MMKKYNKAQYLFSFCLAIFFSFSCFSQSILIIDDIELSGNKKTLDYIILKELPIEIGDTIEHHSLQSELDLVRERLLFTYLFDEVYFNLSSFQEVSENVFRTIIKITVEETTFYSLVPIAELADRNINVWWFEQDRSTKRINLGAHFRHRNLSKRSDVIQLKAQLGYTQKFEVKYAFPSFKSLPQWGFESSALYSRSKEVRINTTDNKEQFYANFDEYQFLRTRVRGGIIYSPDLYNSLTLSGGFHKYNISDTAAHINPNFFGESRTQQRFFDLRIEWERDYRDKLLIPLKGYRLYTGLEKKGLSSAADINTLEIVFIAEKYFSFKDFQTSTQFKTKFIFSNTLIPYFNRPALGYEDDYISAYGYYLIDGTKFAFLKNAIRYHMFDFYINLGRLMPIKSLRDVNFSTYLSFQGDIGYTINDDFKQFNPLNNRLIYGYGPAIDVIYNETIKVNVLFGINHLNETGFFLRINSAF